MEQVEVEFLAASLIDNDHMPVLTMPASEPTCAHARPWFFKEHVDSRRRALSYI